MATYDAAFIIRYVDEELQADEKQQFEADLQKDPALAAEVALYRELKNTLEERLAPDPNRTELENRLATLSKKYFAPAEASRRIPTIRWITGIAAAAAILIATVLLWPSNPDDVVNRLGHTEMIGTSERGNNSDTLLQQATPAFNNGDFAAALPILDRAVAADSNSQLALFYRGIAYWHTGAIDKARTDLQKVYNGESVLRYDAAFYMALTYAAQKNTPVAKDWLGRIPADAPISAKAKELNNSLK